jgi:uncharacterized protein YciI
MPAASPDSARTWIIFLETGKKTPNDKDAVAAMQRGHIDNFKRLFSEKKLSAAGPLRDPSTLKRGIVIVEAKSREELVSYFQPDEYVREGYMTLNATPAVARRPLNTEGIDASGVVEGRIILVSRPDAAPGAQTDKAAADFLQGLIDKRVVGAWYRLESGPISDILFAATKDTTMLEREFAAHPAMADKSATLSVWGQWLSKGVIPGS